MDSDANQRAADRQRSLDAANERRNRELMAANAARNAIAQGMTAGVRDQANERKSAFDARIQQLGDELASTIKEVNDNAVAKAVEERNQRAADKAAREQNRGPQLTMPQMQTSMGEAQKAVGTFSGFGAGLAGGGGVNNSLQSMVKLQSNANKKLDEIAENTASDSDALEFGA
jgi:hypothetical protein